MGNSETERGSRTNLSEEGEVGDVPAEEKGDTTHLREWKERSAVMFLCPG